MIPGRTATFSFQNTSRSGLDTLMRLLGIAGAIVSLAILTAMLSGAFRAFFSVSIGTGLYCSFFAGLVFLFWIFRHLNPFNEGGRIFTILAYTFVWGVGVSLYLYHRPFGGLVSVGGGDAGNHVFSQIEFINRNPQQNSGLVTFFSLSYWLGEFFNIDIFSSFRLVFYLEILFIVFFQISFFLRLSEKSAVFSKNRLILSSLLLVAATYFPAQRILLPLLHYLQGAGFFPQLFGLVPMLLCFLLLPKIPTLHQSAVFLAAFIGFQRFSYSLNLGDNALAAAIYILLAPFSGASKRWQVFYATAFSLLSFFCYRRIDQIISLHGEILLVSFDLLLSGSILGTLSLVLAQRLIIPDSAEASGESRRTLLYPALLCGVSCLAALAFSLRTGGGNTYYVQKYLLLSALSIPLLLTAVGAWIVTEWGANPEKRWLRSGLTLLTMFVSLFAYNKTFPPYWASFAARVDQDTNAAFLKPFRDTVAESLIQRELLRKEKIFGGLLVPDWPQSNFMNASLGAYGELSLFRHARFPERSNSCVFWRNDQQAITSFREQKLMRVLKKIELLRSSAGAETFGYVSQEDGTSRELGMVCANS